MYVYLCSFIGLKKVEGIAPLALKLFQCEAHNILPLVKDIILLLVCFTTENSCSDVYKMRSA